MTAGKRKERGSPEVTLSDDNDEISEEPWRPVHTDRPRSQRRRLSNSDSEGYTNDYSERRRITPGGPRPGVGGYGPPPNERRPPADYDGRNSPGYFQHGPSSSRGPCRRSRSPEGYDRNRDGGVWWSDNREGWQRPPPGRYEEYPPPRYGDEHQGMEYDMQGRRSGSLTTRTNSPAPQGSSGRSFKSEKTMEAPTKRPIQLDRYCTLQSIISESTMSSAVTALHGTVVVLCHV